MLDVVGFKQRSGLIDIQGRELTSLAERHQIETISPLQRGGRNSSRTARSINPLTLVPDSAARFFNRSRRRSSNVIVVRMMQNHTPLTSLHQGREYSCIAAQPM